MSVERDVMEYDVVVVGAGPAGLSAAEVAVQTADAAVTEADHELDEVRRRAHQAADELHHAELRYSELSGRRRSIQERLENEVRRLTAEHFPPTEAARSAS